MNILFTICGRAGSKGVKNKNLKDFCGAPMAYYSLAAMRLYMEKYGAKNEFTVVLNTDSEALIDIVTRQKQLEVLVIRRDESLGGDAVPKVSVIRDCLDRTEQMTGIKYNMVVDLDITSPLRTAEDVRNAIQRKSERPDVDVVYSVTSSRRNPYFNMVKEENGFFVKAVKSEYTSRQQAPVFYDMNASIYAYSPEALRTKDAKVFFNDRADAVVMKDTGVLDIDSEEDYELMQVIAEYLYQKDKLFGAINEKALELLSKRF